MKGGASWPACLLAFRSPPILAFNEGLQQRNTPWLMPVPSNSRQGFTGATRGPNTRVSDAAEQAAMILALASDDASFVAGTVVTVDGGYTAT